MSPTASLRATPCDSPTGSQSAYGRRVPPPRQLAGLDPSPGRSFFRALSTLDATRLVFGEFQGRSIRSRPDQVVQVQVRHVALSTFITHRTARLIAMTSTQKHPPCPPGFSDHIFKEAHGVKVPLRIWPAAINAGKAPWCLWVHGGCVLVCSRSTVLSPR